VFRRSLVGVDIGSRAIKVIEVEARAPDRIQVRGLGIAETPSGALERGMVRDPRRLAEGVREAMRQGNIRQRRASLSVSSHLGFMRRLSFPRMPLAELRANIELQAERYIPFAHDGAVFDLFPLPASDGQPEMTVVLAAAPRSTVRGLMDAARMAGLVPQRVDLEPLSLFRAALAVGRLPAEGSVAFVDLGATAARISVFEGGVPVVSRVLDMPSLEGEARAEGTEEIFWDIRRSLEFALTQVTVPLTRVLVTGGVGGDDHLALSLATYLRSFLANRLPGDFTVEPLKDPEGRVPLSHMIALGLSLPPGLFA